MERHTYLPLSTERPRDLRAGQDGPRRRILELPSGSGYSKDTQAHGKICGRGGIGFGNGAGGPHSRLGTEEFMFPGLLIGAEIENRWPKKRFDFMPQHGVR